MLPSPQSSEPNTSFLLVRDAKRPKVWKWQKPGTVVTNLNPKDWFSPWKEGLNHTPLDLLMPFLNWPSEYEKSGRVCGRPAHLYIFTPPQDNHLYPATIKAVRLAIDDAYYAPLRIEYRDGGILPHRIFSLQSFKKVDDRWIVKAIDSKDRDSGSRLVLNCKQSRMGSIFHSQFSRLMGWAFQSISLLFLSLLFKAIVSLIHLAR